MTKIKRKAIGDHAPEPMSAIEIVEIVRYAVEQETKKWRMVKLRGAGDVYNVVRYPAALTELRPSLEPISDDTACQMWHGRTKAEADEMIVRAAWGEAAIVLAKEIA